MLELQQQMMEKRNKLVLLTNLQNIILDNFIKQKKTGYNLVFFLCLCYNLIMILSFILAGVVVFLDQLTKILIYGTPAKSIIGDLLWFHSTLNTGVAFSMFENMTIVFTIISAIAVAGFSYLIVSKRFLKGKTEKIILGIIMGGTIGNLIDRIIFNGVRDFIYLKFIDFAIFNIADMAISLGAISLCVYLLILEIKNEKNTKKEIIENKTENNSEQKIDINLSNNDEQNIETQNVDVSGLTNENNNENIEIVTKEE